MLVGLVPDDAEVHGLLALMELQASRARARIGPRGMPVLLFEQDRTKWDRLLITRGLAALERAEALKRPLGPYTIQAAIAGCHVRARTPEETDWVRIVALYDALVALTGSPVVELNRAVAISMRLRSHGGSVARRRVGRGSGSSGLPPSPSPPHGSRRPPREAGQESRGEGRAREGRAHGDQRPRARSSPGARGELRQPRARASTLTDSTLPLVRPLLSVDGMRPRWICTLAVGALLSGCGPGSPLGDAMRPPSPHERYAEALRDAGLDDTALGRDWLAAGGGVLANPTLVDLPLRETGYLSPDEPAARAWRFSLAQGRRLVIIVETIAADPVRVYLDLFELRGDPPELQLVASAEEGAVQLDFEPERDGTFVLRLQPELLRGGRFTITETTTASLTFPIEGREGRSVTSSFGDPRGAGGREHEGIDIFAPRGTRVVAAAEGWVSSVSTNNLGGNVIWIRTSRGQSHYYAHLDEQLVGAGTHVRAGEPIGTVGNTGNARTTAPHLHFGIYRRGSGAVDPFPFVFTGTTRPAPVTADSDALGSWRRVSSGVRLRSAPALTAPVVRDLPQHTVVHIDGAVRDWYRVQLPDGTAGFVSGRLTESTRRPVRTARTDAAQLLDRPMVTAAPIADLSARAQLPVLGRFDDFLFVKTPDGREGWIQL